MKHEDFFINYNEVMYNERDVIQKFLDDTADIRYGNQMYEYALSSEVEVLAYNGAVYHCVEVYRDRDSFVMFRVKDGAGNYEVWEAHNFAYGELSKIIDALPEPSEFFMNEVDDDMKMWTKESSVSLEGNPYVWRDGDSIFEVHNICYLEHDDKVGYEVREMRNTDGKISTGYGIWEEIPVKIAKELRAHVNAEILRKNVRYKTLKEQLSHFGGNLYNFVESKNVGAAVIKYVKGSDLQLSVLDVSFEKGSLEVLVSVADTRIADETGDDTLLLTEKDLNPEDLDSLIEFFNEPDVMDTHNGHNKFLVEKINKAWHTHDSRFEFYVIILALTLKYEEEYRDKIGCSIPKSVNEVDYGVAHNLLENVCDDEDLETVLKFLRYE